MRSCTPASNRWSSKPAAAPADATHAVDARGVTLDLGGEWVDEAHADIRALADELGIRLYPFERRKEEARWYVGGAFSTEMPLSDRDAGVHRRTNEALRETASGVDPDDPWREAPADDPSVEDWLRRKGDERERRYVHIDPKIEKKEWWYPYGKGEETGQRVM